MECIDLFEMRDVSDMVSERSSAASMADPKKASHLFVVVVDVAAIVMANTVSFRVLCKLKVQSEHRTTHHNSIPQLRALLVLVRFRSICR